MRKYNEISCNFYSKCKKIVAQLLHDFRAKKTWKLYSGGQFARLPLHYLIPLSRPRGHIVFYPAEWFIANSLQVNVLLEVASET